MRASTCRQAVVLHELLRHGQFLRKVSVVVGLTGMAHVQVAVRDNREKRNDSFPSILIIFPVLWSQCPITDESRAVGTTDA